jgi:uncharacterized protein
MLESRLGLSSWDVLNQGVSKNTPLSFGEANIAVGLIVLAVAWRLGARIGVGTVADAVLAGAFVQLFTSSPSVTHLSSAGLATRTSLALVGLGLIGIGSGLYMAARFGAGPRDSLMVVLAQRTPVRIALVRIALELAATAVGAALGGTVGVGTLAAALGIGPTMELTFWLLARSRLAGRVASRRLHIDPLEGHQSKHSGRAPAQQAARNVGRCLTPGSRVAFCQ